MILTYTAIGEMSDLASLSGYLGWSERSVHEGVLTDNLPYRSNPIATEHLQPAFNQFVVIDLAADPKVHQIHSRLQYAAALDLRVRDGASKRVNNSAILSPDISMTRTIHFFRHFGGGVEG